MTGKARRPRRTTPSTGTTLGAAIGALVGGALFALVDQMPWWVWILLVLGGLVVGFLVHRFRSPRPAA